MFSFVVLVLSYQIVCFGLVFRPFGVLFFLCTDLRVVLKRIIYPGLKLVLIQIGYRGFSFLSHDVRLCFMVFSKLVLVSLD